MRKHAVSILAMTAFIVGSPVRAMDFPDMAPQPNMPGVRFCPAPDCDNGEFLDTYYSIDAKTGKLTAHTSGGMASVDNSHLDAGEVMVMAMPNVNPENRFVPPSMTPPATDMQTFQSPSAYAATGPLPTTQVALPPADPMNPGDEFYGNDRVPWWKGGMWRNRKRGAQGGGNTVEARELPASRGGSASSRGSSVDDDDMWDEGYDDYDGYDDDGSFNASANSSSRVNASSRSRGGSDEYDDEDDPYSTPQFGRDDDSGGGFGFGMTGGTGGARVGGGAAGGRDTYANNGGGGGPLPIPPGGGRGMDDDDFDSPFGGSSGGGMGGVGGGPVGGPTGGMGGGMGMGGGDPVSASASVYSAPASSPSFGDVYSSGSGDYSGGSYSSGGYSGDYSGGSTYSQPYSAGGSSFDSGYIDTSVYAQPTRVEDSVVTSSSSSNEGTGSFLDGSYLSNMNYSMPTIESLTGGYSGGASYSTDSYTGDSFSGGYSAPAPSFDSGGFGPAPSFSSGWYGPGQGSDPFAGVPGPQSFQGAPSPDAQGSPQFENAVRLVKENRFSEAKNILSSETSRNPSNASAWRWLADCYYNLLELDDAINSYQRALERDPNDYYALRGQGFAYLHRGHEYWRRMQEEVARGEKDAAATTFAHAHDNYKKSLELLGLCLRRAPNDGEAVYGEAMAAEGASRKLYSNAISYLKLGPEHRERAELFAENCLTVINKGIERGRERARQNPGDAGPRALLGGLYLRKAILYNQLGKNDLALTELRNSRDVQQSILDEIDKNNATARKNIREAEIYWDRWGGNRN